MKTSLNIAVIGAAGVGIVWYLTKRSRPLVAANKRRIDSQRYKLKQNSKTIDWRVVGTPLKPLNPLGLGRTTKGIIYGLNGRRVFAPNRPNGVGYDFSRIKML